MKNKIAIFSVPRSGSTWLGQIFNSHPNVVYRFQPNFAYSFPYSLAESSNKKEIREFYNKLLKTEDDFVCGKLSISSKKNIEFNKEEVHTLVFKETHYLHIIENLIQNSDTKVIGLIRSPFAVINSWLSIPKEFDPSWDIKDQWRSASNKNQSKVYNYFGFNKWLEATKMFVDLEKMYKDQFKIITYSELLQNTSKSIAEIFDFGGLSIHQQTIDFISKSKQKQDDDAYSIFKAKKSDTKWRTELPVYIIEEIKNNNEYQILNSKFKWEI